MIGDFTSWYFSALVDFWGTALRLGLPQIVLLIIILMWLRKARCRKCGDKSDEKSCCWIWSCGSGGWGGRGCRAECGCTCGQCCCNGGGACDMGAEDEAEVEVEVVEEAEAAAEADDA